MYLNSYAKNYKMLIKVTKDDTNVETYILCSWFRRLNIVKMLILPKLIYRFNIIPTKISARFLCKYRYDYSRGNDSMTTKWNNF